MSTIYDDVVNRLEMLGLTITENDVSMIEYQCGKTEQFVMNFCNRADLPDGLRYVAVDMAAGEYLLFAAAFGRLPPGFNADGTVKSVKIGDTDVEFSTENVTAASFESAVDVLRNAVKTELYRFRKMRWC